MTYEHVWNTSFEASPATSDQASEGALIIRNLKEAIRERMQEGHYWDPAGTDANHGKHTTPTFIDNVTDPAAPTGTNEVKLYNKGGVLQTIKQGGTSVPVGIPSGTKMLFKQSTAPTGWTFVAEDNDRVLINTSTVSEGGALGGGWTISGLTISVAGHALTINEMPSHNHSIDLWWATDQQYDTGPSTGRSAVYKTDTTSIKYTGGGAAHSHGASAAHDGAWRPAYAKVITCTKD